MKKKRKKRRRKKKYALLWRIAKPPLAIVVKLIISLV